MMTFYSLDLVNHTQEVQQTFSSRILEDFFDYQLQSENIFLYSETNLLTYQADVSTQGELPSCWRPTESD